MGGVLDEGAIYDAGPLRQLLKRFASPKKLRARGANPKILGNDPDRSGYDVLAQAPHRKQTFST